MNLTRERAVRLFREHWRGLAETGSRDKAQFIKSKGHHAVFSNCYLCEHCRQGEKTICALCPIEWPLTNKDPSRVFPCVDSYYSQWFCSDSPEERKRLAKIISELPEKGALSNV